MRVWQENRSELYFIALIPGSDLRERVRSLKERMRSDYGAGHALRSPAHITLQMPFKRDAGDESALAAALGKFAFGENPFTVELDGFGCFSPRVIFIRIMKHEAVRSLHGRLKKLLKDELGFLPSEIMNDLQPHITIATRDLTKEAFRDAWPEFQQEEFRGSFEARSLFLLKHNGKSWDILREFPFGEK